MKNNNLFFIFLLLSGGLLMSFELASSRLLYPVFGSGIFIWTFILGTTMSGLALGYYRGSKISENKNIISPLSLMAQLSSSYITLISAVFPLLNKLWYTTNFFFALTISSLLILVPSMIMLGTLSPLSIEAFNRNRKVSAGSSSGKIFFISTIGGVIFLFIYGLILLPNLGTFYSLMIITGLYSFITYLNFKKILHGLIPIIIFCIAIFVNHKNFSIRHGLLYRSESPRGVLEVIKPDSATIQAYLNGILQSESGPGCRLSYADTILKICRYDKKNKDILLIGLGGGNLASALVKENHTVTAVEISKEMIEVSKKFFHVPEAVKIICTDGRDYLNRLPKQKMYDCIILDVFHGEIPPYYLFTLESFQSIHSHLYPHHGKVLINWHGYLNGIRGHGTYVLLHTLHATGFKTRLYSTHPIEDYRNLIIEASKDPFFKKAISYSTTISTDLCPKGELSNALAQLNWRINYFNSTK